MTHRIAYPRELSLLDKVEQSFRRQCWQELRSLCYRYRSQADNVIYASQETDFQVIQLSPNWWKIRADYDAAAVQIDSSSNRLK